MNDEDEWMEVVNIDKLTDFTRKVIYYNFDNENNSLTDDEFLEKVKKMPAKSDSVEELNRVLPFDEVKLILQGFIKKRKNKKTHKVRYFMKEKDYDEVLVQFNQRMISNIVSSLVNRGILESAFDEEKNDFVFWLKKTNNNWK